tara:strand:+ start:236 stop:574 length:339 start_codon:yes stop_codon:yes gene_type:complete
MEKQIQKLIDVIKADYASWEVWTDDSIKQKMIDSFNSCLGFKAGKKYIKIMVGNGGTPMASAWGFIVNVDDDPKFKKGDILKPDGWATPARNKARGNIIEGNFKGVTWTGPA